ncbi:MAG: Crp/Fnr family transcriptional regulator [Myxococcales bacterium]|nr:Crp/Fnr family transcriptional regulator [Myxococcales bacterium]MDD9968291.1 Crp/Fnr family transcriptional regulator [Myxococcales bacterium]
MAQPSKPAEAMRRLRGILEEIPLFAGLEDEEALRIGAAARQRTFQRDEVVVDCGEAPQAVYAIASGRLKVVRPRIQGPDAGLAILRAGELFGEVAILSRTQEGRLARVIALRESVLLAIDAATFVGLLQSSQTLSLRLLAMLAGRLRDTTVHFDDVTSLDVPGRLARKLLLLADRFGSPVQDGVGLQVRLTQRELGELVDATWRDVSACLTQWRLEGALRLRDGQLVIVDLDALRCYADTA